MRRAVSGLGALFLLASAAHAEVRTLLTSAAPGPTVLVVNDPATNDITGRTAIDQVGSWTLDKGKVVVADKADAEKAIADEKPDAVIVLSVRRNATKDTPFQTVATRGSDVVATDLVTALNAIKDEDGQDFVVAEKDGDLPAGPADAARLLINIRSGAITPGARTRMFRHAVSQMLSKKGMTHSDPYTLMAPTKKIRVAMYAGAGSQSTTGVWQYPKSMDTGSTDMVYTYVGPRELSQPKMLDQFDVIVFCGGMSNVQSKAIGADGAEAVRAFVKRGGGYVSSCAGSYLATSGFKWSLKIIDADVIDYKHWLRGTGDVNIELTDEGKKIFGTALPPLIAVHYANGPLLAKSTTRPSDIGSDFTPLAYFRSDMAKSAPGGVMPNTPAIIAGDYGQGRVLCFSPHPEYADQLRSMIVSAVKWTAKRN